MPRTLLTTVAVRTALKALPGWKKRGKAIEKTYAFTTYAAGLDFALRLGRRADANDHHPDLYIEYRRVRVRWMTHDMGGLTALDFEGARLTEEEACR